MLALIAPVLPLTHFIELVRGIVCGDAGLGDLTASAAPNARGISPSRSNLVRRRSVFYLQ